MSMETRSNVETMTRIGETVMMPTDRDFDETDVYLLPYWFAGRVSDETHNETLLMRGNEDETMRSMLAAETVNRRLPVTIREWDAMLHGEELLPEEEAFIASGHIVPRDVVDAWVRQNWHFEAAPASGDEAEETIVACAQSDSLTYCLASAERVSVDGTRNRIYIGVLHETGDYRQGTLWHKVDRMLDDLREQRQVPAKSLPLFESIKVGWDWPVYYRDMVSNSRLLWSASGDAIDLATLAAEQPHEN